MKPAGPVTRAPVFVADPAMDAETCRLVQAAMNAGIVEPAEVLEGQTTLAEDARRASHLEVPQDVMGLVEAHLDAQRAAIGAFFGRRLAGREGVSLLRYGTGGFYGAHIDRAEAPAWPAAARRLVTVVLFLNSAREADPDGGFSGGLLRLFPADCESPVEILSRRGMLVGFPSDTVHEVTPVTSGHRDAAVDWFS